MTDSPETATTVIARAPVADLRSMQRVLGAAKIDSNMVRPAKGDCGG